MKQLAVLIAIAGLVACGGPYKGKPDRLPHGPKKTTPPPDAVDTGPVITYDEECTAHFTDDPMKAKKSSSKAAPFVQTGDEALSQAGTAQDPQMQLADVLQAIDQYKKALVEDHYNAAATYGLAVAYAQVRKKGCALKMLKRLGELNNNARLAGGQGRLDTFLDQVEDEPAFKPFKNDAVGAIGH